MPPFAREMVIELPKPYGSHPQWIIPHSETRTVREYLEEKGIRLIEVRGTWPPENMRLVRALYEWGFLRNDKISVGDRELGIMDVIGDYLTEINVTSPTGLQEIDRYDGVNLEGRIWDAIEGKL